MTEAAKNSSALAALVWDRTAFESDENHDRILKLLNDLIANFHTMDSLPARYGPDATFAVLLDSEHATLQDIRDEFTAKHYESARTAFRSLTGNCTACHSRHSVPVDFPGLPPPPSGSTLEDQFNRAEYLLATRQFEQAEDALLALATGVSPSPSSSPYVLRAIKLWLLAEVRVKRRAESAAALLEHEMPKMALRPHDRELMNSWVDQLREIAHHSPRVGTLNEAKYWVGDDMAHRGSEADEKFVPRTLYATALLHDLLLLDPPDPLRRQALHLLVLSYHHLPVDYLQTSRNEYAAVLITEFPKTPEAAEAFEIYEREAVNRFGRDEQGKVALPEASRARLERLRTLATP